MWLALGESKIKAFFNFDPLVTHVKYLTMSVAADQHWQFWHHPSPAPLPPSTIFWLLLCEIPQIMSPESTDLCHLINDQWKLLSLMKFLENLKEMYMDGVQHICFGTFQKLGVSWRNWQHLCSTWFLFIMLLVSWCFHKLTLLKWNHATDLYWDLKLSVSGMIKIFILYSKMIIYWWSYTFFFHFCSL